MFVDCPRCQTKYLLDSPQEKSGGKRTFKCTKCQEVFNVISNEDDLPTQFMQKPEDILQLPAEKNLYLKIVKGPKAGSIYQLFTPVITIGRGSQADLVIPDPTMSRKHCVIEISPGKTKVRDLDSKNGIIVSGNRIASIIIENKSEFVLGDCHICYIEAPKENI